MADIQVTLPATKSFTQTAVAWMKSLAPTAKSPEALQDAAARKAEARAAVDRLLR